jgi:hypothetical protein
MIEVHVVINDNLEAFINDGRIPDSALISFVSHDKAVQLADDLNAASETDSDVIIAVVVSGE